jgi:low affinity Fe/Cu permease
MKFDKIALSVSRFAGKSSAFLLSVALIVGWAVTGPLFNFSDTWQLVINTTTTIVTFLMVFLIQNSQNRDGLAIQAKLDELISATEAARNDLERIEDKPVEEIERIRR